MRRTLSRIALLLLVLVASLFLYAFRPKLNRYRTLRNAGENYNVEILRDTWGVPHLFGVTDADAVFGLAYAHCEDDFLTIQQGAIAARGDLATVYGMDGAANDYMVDLLRIWDVVEAKYDTELSPEVRAISEAYAAGMNLYAAHNPDEVIPGLFPVTGKDIVAASVHKSPLFFGLDGTLGNLFERVSDDQAVNPTQFAFGKPASTEYTGIGSNTFAVAPSNTPDGSTYFSSNSHQPWTGPVAWYEAHLHSEDGLDVAGGLFPGMPVITLGHNRHVAWSFTVNDPDLIDVYRLELNPDDGDQYRYDGTWRDFETRNVWLDINLVALAGWGDEYRGQLNVPVPRKVYWSEYGPVLRNDNEAYAMRYAAMDSVGIYEQLYRMNRATNRAEWESALAIPGLAMFNIGYADHDGNIGYVYNGLLPIRANGYNWTSELPGNTSETRWTQYLPVEQLPQVWNPPVGFIQNANSTPWRTTETNADPKQRDFLGNWDIEPEMSNRALRLLELFGSDDSVTWEEFLRYKWDMTYSAESDMPQLIAKATAPDYTDPFEQQAAAILANWDMEADPGSPGASIAILTLHYLREDPEVSYNVSKFVGHELPAANVITAFQQAVATLVETHGGVEIPWAQVNRLRRGSADLPIAGAPDVPHAIYGELQPDGRFDGIAGDSYVMMVRFHPDGSVTSESIHQYGSATLDETSPFYSDQAEIFTQRKLKPVLLDRETILDNLTSSYRPQERSR